MRRWLLNSLAYVTGLFLLAILLEAVFRLLPVPMGLYRTEQYQRWPLMNHEPHELYTSSMSWEMRHTRHGSTNNYGHLAPFDYVRGSGPVVVIGDSFIESEMNRYADTLQSQLGQLLGQHESVYGLGANGLSISDYLAIAGLASPEFAPRAAVLLIIDGDVSESLLRQIGHYDFAYKQGTVELEYWPLYGDTFGKSVRRTIGDFALYRYVQMNLHFDPGRLVQGLVDALRSQPAIAPSAPRQMETAERAAIDRFLGELAPTLKISPSCVALLFHADTYGIVDASAAGPRKDPPELKTYFEGRAQALGYRVVDLEPLFRADYQRQEKRLDFWPLDRHLNGRGHGVAARAAFDALYGSGGGRECRPAAADARNSTALTSPSAVVQAR
jgi:hypothetical protein